MSPFLCESTKHGLIKVGLINRVRPNNAYTAALDPSTFIYGNLELETA